MVDKKISTYDIYFYFTIIYLILFIVNYYCWVRFLGNLKHNYWHWRIIKRDEFLYYKCFGASNNVSAENVTAQGCRLITVWTSKWLIIRGSWIYMEHLDIYKCILIFISTQIIAKYRKTFSFTQLIYNGQYFTTWNIFFYNDLKYIFGLDNLLIADFLKFYRQLI